MSPRTLEQLYREHGHAVYRRARRMLRDEEDARDIVQDVFLSLYRESERFQAKSSIATYLYAATTHACLTRLRNGRTRARLIAIETAGWRPLAPARGENQALACELLAALSEEDAALAIYLYCDELTHDEIADLLGCSRRHVGDLANRLRRKLMERVA